MIKKETSKAEDAEPMDFTSYLLSFFLLLHSDDEDLDKNVNQ